MPQNELPEPKSEYRAEDIQILDEIEAVRLRPGMYIGSTDRDGLHQLLYEIVYNGVDEAMAGSCDRIEVTIHGDNSVTVKDNGRGIPVDIIPETDIPALEAVMTRLHAGAKFGGGAYTISSGLHGVGASVVNALSAWFRVEVERDGKKYFQEYLRGVPKGKIKTLGESQLTGTTVTFLPDTKIFESISCDFNVICQRLKELAYLNSSVELAVRDERSDQERTFYFEGGIATLISRINKNRVAIHPNPILVTGSANSTATEVALQYNDSSAEVTFSFANCVSTRDGGSHLTGFRSALTRILNDYARNSKLIKESEPNLTGEDVREGLVAIISVKLPQPQFEGQTKAKLGNPEVKTHVESTVANSLSLYLEQHPDEAKAIIAKCLISAKAREAARKARELVFKKTSFEISVLPGKLADCSEKDPTLCELYLVEGESAGGSAKQGRDRRFQAILPLKGKILNVEKAAKDKIVEHEEIRAIATALRANTDGQPDLARLRYHKIIIMTDADVDGAHIRTLLLTFFHRYMLELINHGFLYIAQPPLYRLSKGKTSDWIYSEEGLRKCFAKKAFENVSVYSKDGAFKVVGEEIKAFLDSLEELNQGLVELEKEGIPRDLSAFLLEKDESFYHIALSSKQRMQELRAWLEGFGLTVKSQSNDRKGEYWLEVALESGEKRFDRQFFEHPILHKCFIAYPKVRHFIEGKSYIIVKNDKEIGRDIHWYRLAEELEKISDRSGIVIQRYKGLGEMSPEQLWETTMNPKTRTLLKVIIEDAIAADQIFTMLMGPEVAPRKSFIQAHAQSVKNLDV